MFKRLGKVLKAHWLAVSLAVLVGLIYAAPQFYYSLNSSYQGIPMMYIANEADYLARMRDILDGYYLLGSPLYYEYKDQIPAMPPVGEYVYVLPVWILGASLTTVLMASKFILPFIFFLLSYVLITKLTANSPGISRRLNAATGSLFLTLGYDIVDYRSLGRFLSGDFHNLSAGFLSWARPVNPVIGGIFLFSFLLIVWKIFESRQAQKSQLFFSGLLLALMFGNYFFSWGIAMSVLVVLILISLAGRTYALAKKFIMIPVAWFLFSAPYWYMAWRAGQSPWYEDSILRNGLFYTHYPISNKFLLAVLLFYVLMIFVSRFHQPGDYKKYFRLKSWELFSLALILGGLWSYSQQILTGLTVWPYHFVQYTIPLGIIVFSVLLYNIIRPKSKVVWLGLLLIISGISISYSIYVQQKIYKQQLTYTSSVQEYKPVLDWLDQQKGDCVVLVINDDTVNRSPSSLVPVFTPCDLYSVNSFFSIMPYERSLHVYMVELRLKGVTPDNLKEYMAANPVQAKEFLYGNWKGLFSLSHFPDFRDYKLAERIETFPSAYEKFFKKDFRQELQKYRLDYILSRGSLGGENLKILGNLKLLTENRGLYLYKF